MPSDPPHTQTTDPAFSDSPQTLQDELKKRALETMRAALKGNGIKTDKVGLSGYKEEPIEFVATTKLVPDTKISVTRKAGKLTTAKLVANANMFQEETNKEVTKITRSPDVINRIKDSVFQREDKGIAVKNEYLKFAFLHRDFIAHEECQACRGQGDTADNLRKAGRYKTLRHILLAALKLPMDKAKAVVLKNNKIGISESTVETLLEEADKALKTITHKPRLIGAMLGVITASALFGLYFFGLRFPLLSALKSHAIMNAIDFACLAIGATLSVFTIQFVAGNALKKALSTIMKAGQNTPKTAKAGDMAYIAIALTILSFALIVWSTTQVGQHSPQWLSYLPI